MLAQLVADCTSSLSAPPDYISIGTETEEEVEHAFQQSVQGTSNFGLTRISVQLTAAVHDMDIDHLLQKLICGEIEYNPLDPNRYAACREALVCLDGMQHKHGWHTIAAHHNCC